MAGRFTINDSPHQLNAPLCDCLPACPLRPNMAGRFTIYYSLPLDFARGKFTIHPSNALQSQLHVHMWHELDESTAAHHRT